MGQVVVGVDDVDRGGELIAQWVAGVDPEHHVGRIVRHPGARVVKIVLGVQRFVAYETVEQARCDGCGSSF